MFKQATNLMGVSAPFEYIPGTNAEAYTLGEALVLSAGRLTGAPPTRRRSSSARRRRPPRPPPSPPYR